jgi:hypothetical protein
MNAIPIILMIAFIGATIVYVFLKKRKRNVEQYVEHRVDNSIDWGLMEGGIRLRAEQGVVVTAAERTAIFDGLTEVFERARRAGYDRPLSHSDYTIVMLSEGERAPESGVWSFRIPAGVYRGSQWDVNGYIRVAGMVVYNNPGSTRNVIVLPNYHGSDTPEDIASLVEAVAHEAWHIILRHCDPAEWKRTRKH